MLVGALYRGYCGRLAERLGCPATRFLLG